MTSLSGPLSNILADAQNIAHYATERLSQFAADSSDGFLLFGAGALGRLVLARARAGGLKPLAFIDNNPKLWSSEVDGLRVLSLDAARAEFGANTLIVVTIYTNAPVCDQLRQSGARAMLFTGFARVYPDIFLPHAAADRPERMFSALDKILAAEKLWEDEQSIQEYRAQIQWRLDPRAELLPSHEKPEDTYIFDKFPADFADRFIDCGAFNGDTVQLLIDRGKKFTGGIALEPDPNNVEAFHRRMQGLPKELAGRVKVYNNAVGASPGVVRFNITGSAASSVGAGESDVQMITIDELGKNFSPTFIKMDIEGAELDALCGGRETISRLLPCLAICLYHRQEDIWQIPLLLREFSKDYALYLRRYSDECWEQVCYAMRRSR